MKIKLPKPRKPKYWEIVVTWTILTVVGLFGAQLWFESYSTSQAFMSELPAVGAERVQAEAAQHAKLQNGALSIEEAMQRVSSAERGTIPLLAPEASHDMGPAAGWMHHPDYAAPPEYDPDAVEPPPEEIVPTDGQPLEDETVTGDLAIPDSPEVAPEQARPPAAPAAPAPAPAPAAAPTPAPAPAAAPTPAPAPAEAQ